MTPQGQQGPFSPHNHPPNGLLPDSSDISSFLQEPAKNPTIPMSMGMSMPPQQHGFPGYTGPRQMHPGMGGMNHPGISMDNRMMGINPPMMTNQGMSGHHGYGQGGYPWPRPYHWDDTVTPIPHEQSDSSVSPKSNISLWLHQNWNKQRHRQKKRCLSFSHRKTMLKFRRQVLAIISVTYNLLF